MDRRLALARVEIIKQSFNASVRSSEQSEVDGGVWILAAIRGRNSGAFVHDAGAERQPGLAPITAKWPVVVETTGCIKAEDK